MERSSGILLHITSLPARFGVGDLGEEAYRFIDFLEASGQHLWQMLPVGPAGFNNVPYQSSSAFAGNILFISLDTLVKDGLLNKSRLDNSPAFPEKYVDFTAAVRFKMPLLYEACNRFKESASGDRDFNVFCENNAYWLENYSLYAAIKEAHSLKSWIEWEKDIRLHTSAAVDRYRALLAGEILDQKVLQYIFYRQWRQLKNYCNVKNIKLIGDIPIFMALDSADVWAGRQMYFLDESGNPESVAGVPPDYFSKTGQLWGNPLYRWDVMRQDNFRWWVERVRAALSLFDYLRIDHFRGFEKYWAIPGGDKTAEKGKWVPGPGAALFESLQSACGRLPIIAEDLGIITPEVEALRDQFGFPGMRVLQFAFNDDPKENCHLPHLHVKNCVVYTGTHDNTTTIGWFRGEDIRATTQDVKTRRLETDRALKYLGTDGSQINWEFIRLAFNSVADTAIIPMQDILGLGNEARMNTPGVDAGNWRWRMAPRAMTTEIAARLKEMTWLAGR